MLRSARDRREPWYVWVVEEWVPRRPAPAAALDTGQAERPAERRPQLRGRKADEAAGRYLDGALDDGCWHELEGLWILARAQGIPRRAFDQSLEAFSLESARRGSLDERFVRLASHQFESAGVDWPALDPWLDDEQAILADLAALVTGGHARLELDPEGGRP